MKLSSHLLSIDARKGDYSQGEALRTIARTLYQYIAGLCMQDFRVSMHVILQTKLTSHILDKHSTTEIYAQSSVP